MRAVQSALLLAGVATLAGAQDAREIVRRAVERDPHNLESSRAYSYQQRQETRELDKSGHIKSRRIETWEVTALDGSPYRRLVARNDQPLAAEEQKAENERLRWNQEQRRRESADQRARRRAEWQARQARQREPVKELPDAFNFTLVGEEQAGGRTVYRIDALPKPGYKPKSSLAAFFPKVKLRLWIDKAELQGARIEMETLDGISFGGFLLRLGKGTRLTIEQTRVSGEVWLPRQVSVTAAARILLVKGINRELDFTFSDYKESQVVATAENQ